MAVADCVLFAVIWGTSCHASERHGALARYFVEHFGEVDGPVQRDALHHCKRSIPFAQAVVDAAVQDRAYGPDVLEGVLAVFVAELRLPAGGKRDLYFHADHDMPRAVLAGTVVTATARERSISLYDLISSAFERERLLHELSPLSPLRGRPNGPVADVALGWCTLVHVLAAANSGDENSRNEAVSAAESYLRSGEVGVSSEVRAVIRQQMNARSASTQASPVGAG